jgi:hypothetical protein
MKAPVKTITLTVFNRPDYTRQVIEALRANNTEGYRLLIAAEEREAATVAECLKVDFMPVQIFYNFSHLGIKWTAKRIYDIAFHLSSEFNVAIEDDIPLAPDALDLANWFFEHPRRSDYFTLNLFNGSRDFARPLDMVEMDAMCPWGYCFTRKTYREFIEPNWMCDERGWDFSMCEIMRALRLKSLAPVLSRSRNIGRLGGTFCTPELYDRSFTGQIASDGSFGKAFQLSKPHNARAPHGTFNLFNQTVLPEERTPKIFGIGLSKTGTVSLTESLCVLGYQTVHLPFTFAEIEQHDAATDTSIACQFKLLDRLFPNSKFIYTVRDIDEWLESCRHHWHGRNEVELPTNFLEKVDKALYGRTSFDRAAFIEVRQQHEAEVRAHFRNRKHDLLEMDICAGDGWEKLCPFLEREIPSVNFPHHNKTLPAVFA